MSGKYVLDIDYERLLGAADKRDEPLAVPFLTAVEVHRQRGMVALLAGQELTLRPVTEAGVSPVGENQLPSFVRKQITKSVAHTYKYIDPTPGLEVRAVAPERRQGRFDAQVDTLISLGEVTMKGAASIEIDVKAGSIVDLTLGPAGKTSTSWGSPAPHCAATASGRSRMDSPSIWNSPAKWKGASASRCSTSA